MDAPQLERSWGAHAPFQSLAVNGSDETLPGCTVTFAQVLSRHGARFPTSGNSRRIQTALEKVNVALSANDTALPESYAFLRNYTYTLGKDNLTQFGEQELVDSGSKFFARYASIGGGNTAPFVRVAGSPRVVQSALNFTQGYNDAAAARHSAGEGESPLISTNFLIIPEDKTSNNTLHVETCPAFTSGPLDKLGDVKDQEWLAIFTPSVAARLNADLGAAGLDGNDTVALMDLCTFDTVASPTGALSPFCQLFTDDEWASYSFHQDLDKYFGDGPGNPLGPTQGAGWVNELVARLTDSPVVDATSSNATLDASDATFPLRRPLYVDFSHDTQMTSIFAAMRLFDTAVARGGLDPAERASAASSGYSTFTSVPFSARMYVEKMTCEGQPEEMVRVLVNDAVQPLEFCGGDELGRCTVADFVASQGFARSGGKWNEC